MASCTKCHEFYKHAHRLVGTGYQSLAPLNESFRIHFNTRCSLCLFLLHALDHLVAKGNEFLYANVTLTQNLEPDTFHLQRFLTLHIPPANTDSGVQAINIPLSFDDLDARQRPNTVRALHPRDINFDILKGWIRYCQSRHIRKCTVSKWNLSRKLETLLVVDCRTRCVIKAPDHCSYVALSYVWGRYSLMDATPQGPLPSALPDTIADAITVTKRLGFNYLWVDKYCIDQSNTHEMHRQLATMDQIYRMAELTIIAAAGYNADHGLPGVNGLSRLRQPAILVAGRRLSSGLRDPEIVIRQSSWYSRAWTYQEGLFSRRRLIFTEEQVVYECDTEAFRESIEDRLDSRLQHSTLYDHASTSGLFKGAFSSGYYSFTSHISQYTKRTLSYQSDALNALGGVFRAFSSLPIYQFQGIPAAFEAFMPNGFWAIGSEPRSDQRNSSNLDIYSRYESGEAAAAFSFGLLWHLDGVSYPARRSNFPSWSWAGWIAPVSWPAWNRDGVPYRKQKVEIEIETEESVIPLTSANLARIQDRDMGTHGISPVIRIYAETLRITLDELDCEGEPPKFGFYVRTQVKDRSNRNIGRLVLWKMSPTVAIRQLELDQRGAGVYDCIVLCGAYGLVVWGDTEVKTRVGVISLRGYGYHQKRVGPRSWYKRDVDSSYKFWLLQDWFRKETRTVRIG